MEMLWPMDGAAQAEDAARMDSSLRVDDLEKLYDFPENLQRPWVRVNFVSSLDGAVTLRGSSRGLSSSDDQRVLGLIRDLSDVVLVGLGTAKTEGYRGVKRKEVRTRRRSALGLSEVPPIALVTASCSIPEDSPLLTDTIATPIVLTCESAPTQRRKALADAGADVVVAGQREVDLTLALEALDQRGLRRIGCEGGPTLFGELAGADLVDELCLSLSPMVAGGDAGRITAGQDVRPPSDMHLLSAVRADESLLLLRYGRQRS